MEINRCYKIQPKKQVFLHSVISIALTLSLYYVFIQLDYHSDSKSIKQKSTTCEIIKPNIEHFRVTIDGLVYPHRVSFHQNKSLDYKCMKSKNTKQKLILLWTKWFNDPTFEYGVGKYEPFKRNGCPIDNCEITTDKNRLNESDFVVVHMRDQIENIPDQHMNHHARWIFLLYESPVHSPRFSEFNNKFSLSATYRLDSDFSGIYQSDTNFEWSANVDFNANEDFLHGKTGFAVAIVSNCYAPSRRLEFIGQMQTIASVHVLGNCGEPCPKAFDNGTIADCKLIISQKYKFFLAFENSICQDYITEKLFDILQYNIIPVVYGYGPYHLHIPKSAYINAFDFKTPVELTKYMIYLASNKTAYNGYFKWKRFVKYNGDRKRNHRPIHTSICEMCIRLNIDEEYGFEKRFIEDLDMRWNLKSNCKRVESNGTFFQLVDYEGS